MLCIWSVTVCISKIGAIELEKILQRKVFHHHAGSTSHWNGSSKNHWRLVERFGMEFSFIWSRYCILRGGRFFPSRCPCYKNQKCASGKYKYFFKKLNIFWDSKHDNVSAIPWGYLRFNNSLRFHLNFRSQLLLYTFWWKRLMMILWWLHHQKRKRIEIFWWLESWLWAIVSQFNFWSLTLKLELLVFSFVRSIRMGNFRLYKQSIKSLLPCFFALDHTNYSRWLSVLLVDIFQLEKINTDIATAFKNDMFVDNKTRRSFHQLGSTMLTRKTTSANGDGGKY